jgi:hypothetical protein
MDQTGSWEIAKDEHDAFEALDQNSGGLARRLVRLRVTMRAPVVTDVDVAVPDEAGRPRKWWRRSYAKLPEAQRRISHRIVELLGITI